MPPETARRTASIVLVLALLAASTLTAGELNFPQDTNYGSQPDDGILETPLGTNWVIEPGNDSLYSDIVIALNGGLDILPSGRLTLDNVTLIANVSGVTINVQPNGALIIRNYSTLDAGPWENGAAGGLWQLNLKVAAGGSLVVENSEIRHVGRLTPSIADLGVYTASSDVSFRDALIASGYAGLVLDNATGVTATNLTFTGSSTEDLVLLGASSLELTGGSYATWNISGPSRVNVSYLVDVKLDDTMGRPIQNLDFMIAAGAQVVYATPGFGGSDERSRIDRLYRPIPRWTPVPSAILTGSPTAILIPVEMRAAYGEWTETRALTLAANIHITFVKSLAAPTFTDVASDAGVSDPTHAFTNNTRGPGAAWADYDRDGDLDLYVTGSATMNGGFFVPDSDRRKAPNHLFRQNADGTFTDVSDLAGVGYEGSYGVTFADFDNDGWPDLYLANYGWGGTLDSPGEPNVLYHNNGDGTFTNVTAQAGVGDPGHSVGSAWADYDKDGDLDLYVVNQGILLFPFMRNETNALYRNNGDGTFTNVSAAAGHPVGGKFDGWGLGRVQALILDFVPDTAGNISLDGAEGSGMSFAAIWFDFDNDGWQDLLVGNDFGVSPLYRNSRDGTFTDVTAEAGLDLVGSSMGWAVHDLDGNGWLDIYQTNYSENYLWMNYNGTFVEEARARGVDDEMVGWGTDFQDLDNDGDFDLLVANGRVSFAKPLSLELLYRNEGDGTFVDATADAGLNTSASYFKTMGLATADYNRDGCMDVYLANSDGRNQLLRNDCRSTNRWVDVRLVGTVSTSDALGARVHVFASGGFHEWQELTGGESYASGNSLVLHFGLGDRPSVTNITVQWPSGARQTLLDKAANATYLFTEPADVAVSAGGSRTVDEDLPAAFNATVTHSNDPDFERHAVFEWSISNATTNTMLTGRNASFTFQDAGVFEVLLSVFDPSTGVAAQDTITATVRDRTPPALVTLQPPAEVAAGAYLNLTASATDNDPHFAQTANFTWTIAGPAGFSRTLHGAQLSFLAPGPGTYNITLTAADSNGNTASQTFAVSVPASPPASSGGIDPLVLAIAAAVGLAVMVGAVLFRRLYRK